MDIQEEKIYMTNRELSHWLSMGFGQVLQPNFLSKSEDPSYSIHLDVSSELRNKIDALCSYNGGAGHLNLYQTGIHWCNRIDTRWYYLPNTDYESCIETLRKASDNYNNGYYFSPFIIRRWDSDEWEEPLKKTYLKDYYDFIGKKFEEKC